MCIAPDGIVFYETKCGSFKASDFVAFLEALAARFQEVRDGEVCLVMDNARIHHATSATQYLAENGIDHVYLPPYSPDLNPIENVFGVVKQKFRSMGVVWTRVEMNNRIVQIIRGMNEDSDLSRYYEHKRGFVRKALNRQPFN